MYGGFLPTATFYPHQGDLTPGYVLYSCGSPMRPAQQQPHFPGMTQNVLVNKPAREVVAESIREVWEAISHD